MVMAGSTASRVSLNCRTMRHCRTTVTHCAIAVGCGCGRRERRNTLGDPVFLHHPQERRPMNAKLGRGVGSIAVMVFESISNGDDLGRIDGSAVDGYWSSCGP